MSFYYKTRLVDTTLTNTHVILEELISLPMP